MSNLSLPSMSHGNLRHILENSRSNKSRIKLAYATEVQQNAQSIAVLHHGHIIAEVTEDHIELDNHGYDTVTTAARMSRILSDNGFSERVAIRQGEMALIGPDGKIAQRGVRTVTAKRVNGVDMVQAYNG